MSEREFDTPNRGFVPNIYQQAPLEPIGADGGMPAGFDGPCSRKVHPELNVRLAFCFFAFDGQANDIFVNGRHIHSIRWLTGAVWACGKILPDIVCEVLGLPSGSTYAKGARQVRRHVREVVGVWIAALTLPVYPRCAG